MGCDNNHKPVSSAFFSGRISQEIWRIAAFGFTTYTTTGRGARERIKRLMSHGLAPSKSTIPALVALTGALLTGCATIPTPTQTQETSSAHDSRSEAVFKYQSQIATRVLDRFAYIEIDGGTEPDPTLAAADSRMAEVCRYLNEAAVSRAEGRRPTWDLKLKVIASTGPCARAAREVELLLDNDGDTIATAKL
jgi:hypothetical protein